MGCGTGHLTAQIAESGAEVVGIDSSEDMVRVASENYPHIRFEVADARSLPFEGEFDAVFSNAVLHWVRPPEAVVDSVRRALRPGGRFVAEFGGENNIRAIMTAVGEALDALERNGTKSTGRISTSRHWTSTFLSWKAATSASRTRLTSRGQPRSTAAKTD